jgi:hypothetical protein
MAFPLNPNVLANSKASQNVLGLPPPTIGGSGKGSPANAKALSKRMQATQMEVGDPNATGFSQMRNGSKEGAMAIESWRAKLFGSELGRQEFVPVGGRPEDQPQNPSKEKPA